MASGPLPRVRSKVTIETPKAKEIAQAAGILSGDGFVWIDLIQMHHIFRGYLVCRTFKKYHIKHFVK